MLFEDHAATEYVVSDAPVRPRRTDGFSSTELIVVGTDPVALDRLLIDTIEEKRSKEGAPSIFDRCSGHMKADPGLDVRFNAFIREPGHVEYASHLGLGEYDKTRIREQVVEL